jgi:predicted cupin superfamily sugar epimerase
MLGKNLDDGEVFQAVVPHGACFGANLQVPHSFALAGCTVAPGFIVDDLEIAQRDDLINLFPKHRQIIEQLIR